MTLTIWTLQNVSQFGSVGCLLTMRVWWSIFSRGGVLSPQGMALAGLMSFRPHIGSCWPWPPGEDGFPPGSSPLCYPLPPSVSSLSILWGAAFEIIWLSCSSSNSCPLFLTFIDEICLDPWLLWWLPEDFLTSSFLLCLLLAFTGRKSRPCLFF